jgi:ATP-dependent Lhr-like helicase
MRFLFAWQHVDPANRLTGIEGVRSVVEQLEGFDIPLAAWERDVLTARVDRYERAWLDALCLSGQVGWARLSTRAVAVDHAGLPRETASSPVGRESVRRMPRAPGAAVRPLRTTPIALFLREHVADWRLLRPEPVRPPLSDCAREALTRLEARGALFPQEIEHAHRALGELATAGLVTADSFGALRAMVGARNTATQAGWSGLMGGRWSTVPPAPQADGPARQTAIELLAVTLLRRYGVVFRRMLAREPFAVSWRELATVYRRLEARGEIRGGRFVNGMSGEQFALPDAIAMLREVRRSPVTGHLLAVSAADPLNLAGIVTAGDSVPARASARIAYRDGVPLAALEGDYVRQLSDYDPSLASAVAQALAGRSVPPVMHGYIGRAG